ncbi:hypothetical protein PROFUN_08355 [Planoprotostelium fungivorum]|uniref:Uncharacterized protein n=1 Tax=Planoprotostelium fungivorum TaxID=1890364 RepID=A0A2P6NI67_9EUKA|nr:hypothetical protein PROFUN_08355 [Planoprotostelium fungivorum]
MSDADLAIKSCVETIPRPILGKIYKWKVARASIIKGEDLPSTSKIHTFKPVVEIPEAIAWLLKHKSIDGALIFENENSLVFVDGKFEQLIEL